MVAGSGKMNSLPHVPGSVFSPNSPPASLVPNHLQLPAPGGAVEVGLTEVAKVVEAGGLLEPEPGRHWLYHWLETVQVYPETQVVAPVQPEPPHWA